ncbi:hypothetical protein PRSY57_1134600 [Plasmodium reichenowi]|uniref:Uncharacterized protein n=1 Tax=Plasmodium reichenowi TaxID=5854 RepID=A0A151LCP5_PLARE|nr:hypothetical protein PRSY57_1134600 [Plasmodium reichenowi]KYN96699.1 hypothetical protein PRSY57_1134600 [Plasmodium reichenowi]
MNLNKISVLLKIIIFKNTLYIFDNVCTSINVNDLGYKVSDTINSFKYKKNYDNPVVLDKIPDSPLDNKAKLSFQELLRKRSSDDDDDNDDEGDNDDDDDDNDNNNNNNNNNMNRFYNMASIQPAAFNNISQNGNQSFTARMKQNLSKYNPFKKSGSNSNGKVNNPNENVDEDNNENVDDNDTKKKHRHKKHKSQGTLSNDGSNNMNNNNMNNNNMNNNNMNNINVNNSNMNNNINNNMNNNNNVNNNLNNNVNSSNILLGASALTGATISGQNQNGINNNQNVVNNNTNNGTIQNSIMLNNSSSIFSNLFENNNKFNTSEMICSSINCTSINSQNNDKIPLTDCSNVLYCGNCPFSSSPKDQCASIKTLNVDNTYIASGYVDSLQLLNKNNLLNIPFTWDKTTLDFSKCLPDLNKFKLATKDLPNKDKNEVSKRLFRLANLYLYTTKFVEDNNNNPLKISINFNNINIDSLKPTEQLANECNSLLPCPLNIAEIKTYNIHATQSLVLYQRLFIPEIYNALNTSNIMINITSDPGYNVANYFFYVKIDCAKTNDIIENEIYPTATLPQTNQQTTQQTTQQTIPQTPIENNPQQNETKNGTPPKNDTSVQLLKNNTSSNDSRRGYSYRNSSHSIIFIFSIITYILFL